MCHHLFYRYYSGRCLSKLAELFPFPHSGGRFTCYSNSLHGFLSPFLDVKMMSMSTVSFLTQLDPGIRLLHNTFL